MHRDWVVLRMCGGEFSPEATEAAAGILFTKKHEKGELGHHGRHKGQPVPYGFAELAVAEPSGFLQVPNEEFFGSARKVLDAARGLGAVDASIHIDVEYDVQCNLEISPAVQEAVGRLGVPITITCWMGGEEKVATAGDQLARLAKAVHDEASFLGFLGAMTTELRERTRVVTSSEASPYDRGALGWENVTLDDFLDAAMAWATDTSTTEPPTANPWGRVAAIMLAGKGYE